MENSSRKAVAARLNGRKGGTKSPDRSRWNSLKHAAYSKQLSIAVGNHLPEYPAFAAMHTKLENELCPQTAEAAVAIGMFVMDTWRLQRAFRFELSQTEQNDGIASAAMQNVTRYVTVAHRHLAESIARMEKIRAQLPIGGGRGRVLGAASDHLPEKDDQTGNATAAADDSEPEVLPVPAMAQVTLQGLNDTSEHAGAAEHSPRTEKLHGGLEAAGSIMTATEVSQELGGGREVEPRRNADSS